MVTEFGKRRGGASPCLINSHTCHFGAIDSGTAMRGLADTE